MSHALSSRSHRLFIFAGIALAAGAAVMLTACSSATSVSSGGPSGTLKVVATTTQLTDFAAEVGGENIELTGLLHAGASAHHFDPTPADLLALGEADVLVVNGAGLESFVDSAVDASGFDGTVITASDGVDEALAKEVTAENTSDTDHDHGDVNPHIWTSPRFAEGMVAEIARGFAAADPHHAAGYDERAESYVAKLQDLDTWIAAQFERVPDADRVIVSGHDSLEYYLHDYGIEFAGSILPSFEDNAEPSAADIDELVHSIRDRGVKAVFVESSMSPKLAQTIAQEAGVQVVDADALYADSLGVANSGADTYLSATIHNTRLILESWGVEAEDLPATLQ